MEPSTSLVGGGRVKVTCPHPDLHLSPPLEAVFLTVSSAVAGQGLVREGQRLRETQGLAPPRLLHRPILALWTRP